MKKTILVFTLVILIVLLAQSFSYAGPVDIAIKGSYLSLSGTGSFFDQLEATTQSDPFFDDVSASKFNGFLAEVEVIWKMKPSFHISGTVGLFKKSVDLDFNSPSFSLTDTYNLTAFPILASVKYKWRGTSKIIPYLGGGVSIYPFTLELEDETVTFNRVLFLTPLVINQTISSTEVGLGGHVVGGMEIVLNRRISFLVEDRFTLFGETELEGFNNQTLSLTGNQIQGGILFKF